jgi:rubrerythrin
MKKEQLEDLLLQALETELGGVQIYTTALQCVTNSDLREEWEKYLEQTKHHVEVMRDLITELSFDPDKMTPTRQVVHHIGESLVEAMQIALKNAPGPAREIVACECVVLAETKDHANWELINQCAKKAKGDDAKALKAACDEVEDEEDEHLYHSKGWCRELAIQALGMKAVLPPPEEEKDVKTAIGAARAQNAREELL